MEDEFLEATKFFGFTYVAESSFIGLLASSIKKVANSPKWIRKRGKYSNLIRLTSTREASVVVKRRIRSKYAIITVTNWITLLVSALNQRRYALTPLC